MKRKFLSIACCLLMLFSTVMLVTACGKAKPVAVSRKKAELSLISAVELIEASNAVKMEIDSLEQETFYVATSDVLYQATASEGLSLWTEKDGNYWYEFFTVSTMVGEFPGIDHNKCLSSKVLDDPRNFIVKTITDFELGKFSKASKLKGVLTVNYKLVKEDETIQTTFKIADSKIISLNVKSKTIATKISFTYDDKALESLIEKPQGIEWIAYESKIEVENIKTNYLVDEELDLTDAVLKYYKLYYLETFENLELTRNMITGFTTNEPGTRIMTINFGDLTYTVEYTVTEPAAAE